MQGQARLKGSETVSGGDEALRSKSKVEAIDANASAILESKFASLKGRQHV
jgi:hypothetical protein